MKLTLNDDGTVTIPLMPDPETKRDRAVTLPEPSMRQLGAIHDIVAGADDAMPKLDTLSEEPTPAQTATFQKQLQDRSRVQYADDSPYGNAVIKIIELVTGESYTPDDLPGWVCSPRTCNQILSHFQSPLPG